MDSDSDTAASIEHDLEKHALDDFGRPLRTCRQCGCTPPLRGGEGYDCRGCTEKTGREKGTPSGCSWVEEDLCSACFPPPIGGRQGATGRNNEAMKAALSRFLERHGPKTIDAEHHFEDSDGDWIRGIREAAIYVAIYYDQPTKKQRAQLTYAIAEGEPEKKPILLLYPNGPNGCRDDLLPWSLLQDLDVERLHIASFPHSALAHLIAEKTAARILGVSDD